MVIKSSIIGVQLGWYRKNSKPFLRSNLFPKFHLTEEGIEYRFLFGTTKTPYNEVLLVDTVCLKNKRAIQLKLKHEMSGVVFLFGWGNRKQFSRIVKVLYEKGCPLTESALEYVRKPNN